MGKVSNGEVVRELKDGNRLGCVHLLDLYQDRLTGEAVNVFHIRQEDAEEVVSDSLLTVVQKIQTFEFTRSDGDFHYWVMTIFRNRVRDFVRRAAATAGLTEAFDESVDEGYSQTEREVTRAIIRQYEESLCDAPTDIGKADKLAVIAETLDGMESWERVLLRCRALDVPYEEISSYTGKPVKQLKVYHARVKKKFVKLLAERYPELLPDKNKMSFVDGLAEQDEPKV